MVILQRSFYTTVVTSSWDNNSPMFSSKAGGLKRWRELKMLTAERKTEVIASNRKHDNDTGSPEVQIAILTEKLSI